MASAAFDESLGSTAVVIAAVQPIRSRCAALAIAIVVALATLLALSATVAAHAEIERTSPEENAVLAAPPQRIEFWTTEAVATGNGSPGVSVLDENGKPLTVEDLQVDPNDPRHVTASVPDVGFGTFTVVWSMRSDVDGHTLNGTFAFRVGGTNRAPGAATVEGERPRAWAVATRWITFLGAAVAAAGFLIGPLLLGRQDDGSARRRFALIAIAATVGLLATLAEPLFQTLFPPSGVDAPSLSDAIGGLPNAWFLRAPGLALAAVIASVLLARRAARATDVFTFTGAAAALIAILGLALTSHASARESWRALAIGSVVIHQWAVALWTGGLAHLLIARPYDAEAGRPQPIQRFSRYALGLAAAGIATGVLNAGLLLPTLRSLWESDYGKVVIAKAIVLVPVLALATFHRQTLRRTLERAASAFRLTLRLETALVVVIVLGGSILALLAPPSVAESTLANLDLAAPFSPNDPAGRYVRFVLDPAGQGENEIAVSVTNGPPRFLNEENVFADAPLVTDIALVRVALVNLERATAPIEVELTVDNSGTFRSPEIQLGLDGWWRAEVVVRQLGVEDVTVPFYVLLPDPNVHGESAVDNPDEAPDAKFLFERGLNGFTSLSSVHYVQRLAGGTGAVVVADYVIH